MTGGIRSGERDAEEEPGGWIRFTMRGDGGTFKLLTEGRPSMNSSKIHQLERDLLFWEELALSVATGPRVTVEDQILAFSGISTS